MRTYTTILAVAVAGLAASNALAQTGGIRNSAHNFTSYSWASQEICKPCHIPHGGSSTAGALWNHEMSNASYTLFDGTSSAAGGADALDRVSMLCMSCHDGTVALDSFGGATGSVYIDTNTSITPGDGLPNFDGAAKLGTDLRNDHPIGKTAVYTTSTTSTSFNPQVITTSFGRTSHKVYTPAGIGGGTGSSTGTGVSLYQMTVGTNTDSWVVGCKTCHDPHNNGVGAPPHMLRFSNTGSALCLTCHIK